LATTALSLSAFSFAAGFGIRGLATMMTSGRFSPPTARATTYARLASTAPSRPDVDLRPAELYKDVLNKLHIFYVEKLPPETELARGSIEQMLAELRDPNTRLLSPREWEALQQLTQGSLHGLGAVLTIRTYSDDGTPSATPPAVPGVRPPNKPEAAIERNITVVAPLPGSVAEKAGLQPGDRITHLDGHWIAPMHLSFRELSSIEDDLGPQDLRPPRPADDDRGPNVPDAAEREKQRQRLRRWVGSTEINAAMEALMAGQPGEHELTVERAGQKEPLKIKLAFADGRTEQFASRKLDATTGYIRIGAIRATTPQEVAKALTELQRDGAQKLVLDLRRSPGGSLDAAVEIAGQLSPGATVYVSKERDASRKIVEKKVVAKKDGEGRAKPPTAISVLVDGGTAGSAEVLAACLREARGAKLVGEKTFGDGTEQQFVPLKNGAAVSITHAQMLSPKGAELEVKGLMPDLPGGSGDAAIQAAVKALAAAGPAPAASLRPQAGR
jgi:carboxyl-terminal processing protease